MHAAEHCFVRQVGYDYRNRECDRRPTKCEAERTTFSLTVTLLVTTTTTGSEL